MTVRELGELVRETAWQWWNDDTFRLSAALAFYTIFSLAPVLLIAVAVASSLVGEEAATRHLIAEIQGLVGSEGARAVAGVLERVRSMPENPYAAIAGALLLIAGSTAVFAELQSALNQIWDVRVETRGVIRGFLRNRLMSFAIVLGVGFLLLVSLVLSASLSAAQELLEQQFRTLPAVWRVANVLTSFLLVTLLFGMIYKVLPDVELRWADVAIGAVVTAALFAIGKYAIGLYLGQLAFASRYGAAASFVVLLFWVYYSALVCFLGAEFTQVYAQKYGSGIRPKAHARRIGRKPDGDRTRGQRDARVSP